MTGTERSEWTALTVGELIAELQKMPPEAEVIATYDSGYADGPVNAVEMHHEMKGYEGPVAVLSVYS